MEGVAQASRCRCGRGSQAADAGQKRGPKKIILFCMGGDRGGIPFMAGCGHPRHTM
jgi:hypothetical protein